MTRNEFHAYATAFREAVLAGGSSARMCAAIAAPLAAAFVAMGHTVELVRVLHDECDHVFIILPDGKVLDPTADQFGLERVYLGPPVDVHAGASRWDGGEPWIELLVGFRRMFPAFAAAEVGSMVRRVLETFPSSLIELPTPGLDEVAKSCVHSAPP